MFDFQDYLAIGDLNVFLLLGDTSHLASIVILLYKILKTKSCSGVSGQSQMLLGLVFLCRWSDIVLHEISIYTIVHRAVCLTCIATVVYLIHIKYNNTYDREQDTYRADILVIVCLVLAHLINYNRNLFRTIWTFSLFLETVAIVPQLWLTSKVGCTHYMAHYLIALGYYRIFYIMNWMYDFLYRHEVNPIVSYSSVVQSLIFISLLSFVCMKAPAESHERFSEVSDECKGDCEKSSVLDIGIDKQRLIKNMQWEWQEKLSLPKDELPDIHRSNLSRMW